MKRLGVVMAFLAYALTAHSQDHPVERPHILGIDHVCFYTTDQDGVKALYGATLGLAFPPRRSNLAGW